MSLLELRDIHVSYRVPGRPKFAAVSGVSLTVEEGEIVGLVGESGCGKSSLAKVAVGLVAPTKGLALYRNHAITPLGLARRKSRDLGVQMIFQNPYSSLNPRRTVGSQLLDGLVEHLSKKQQRDESARLLEMVGLSMESAGKFPHQFSGGQRQRIAIARSLAAKPSIVIADEPVTALDASSQAQIVKLLTSLVNELKMSMLFISHDLSLVRSMADRVIVMHSGSVVEEGSPDDIWHHPKQQYTQQLIAAIPTIGKVRRLPGLDEEELRSGNSISGD